MTLQNKVSNKTKIIVISLLSLLVLLSFIVIATNAIVIYQAKPKIRTEFSEHNTDYCILVLGAGLKPDGTPSEILQDRLDGAIALYQSGISNTLILSGDCSGEAYDEVGAMEIYCLEQGVLKEHIVRDTDGFSTYESMKNTIQTMGYKNLIVVTQRYHLYRAMYIAENMGASVVGFPADYHIYRGQLIRDTREVLARVKDFFLVSFSSIS